MSMSVRCPSEYVINKMGCKAEVSMKEKRRRGEGNRAIDGSICVQMPTRDMICCGNLALAKCSDVFFYRSFPHVWCEIAFFVIIVFRG